MPSIHGALTSLDEKAELWTCQDDPQECPYRLTKGSLADARFRCRAFETTDDAAAPLRPTAGHAADMSILRRVLSTDPRALRGMSDHQVITRVASLLVSRRLCLVIASPDAPRSSGAARQPAPARAPAVTPSRMVERAAPAEAAPTVAESELADDVNQALQAAALEQAAALGAPFCEVCEKAKPETAP
jgi:hypothetical protein